jgi:hypothetical protein
MNYVFLDVQYKKYGKRVAYYTSTSSTLHCLPCVMVTEFLTLIMEPVFKPPDVRFPLWLVTKLHVSGYFHY